MVLAYHLIFGSYGFGLPNEERGSWSDFVGAWELLRFGEATRVHTRRSVAGERFDPERRRAAQAALKYPPVVFNDAQIAAIGLGFADYVQRSGLQVHACAILPEHTHLVTGRSHLPVERVADQLRAAATHQLNLADLHPLAGHKDRQGRTPKPWATGEWKVFLNHVNAIERAVPYVEANPGKEGRSPQTWPFVVSWRG